MTFGTTPSTASRSSRLRLDVLTSARELDALGPVWNDLQERSGLHHPFLTHEWIRTWWECFGGSADLRVLLIRERDGRPVALAPLAADETRMLGVGLARLGLPWNLHTPRLGMLVAERTDEVHRVLWDHLRAGETGWHVLQLCQLPEGSQTSHRLAALATSDGFLVGRWTAGDSPWVEIRGTWEDYFAGLSSKHRATVRHRLRRLEEIGPVELEAVDGTGAPAALEDALTDGFRLEGSAWKRNAGTAILSRSETEDFYRLLGHRVAERGWLRLHFLRVGGRRIAFVYSLFYRDTLYALKCGYDPELAHTSPGLALFALVLRDAFARGLRAFDFLGDAERWKLSWTRATREHHWLYIFRPSARTRLIHRVKFGLVPWLHAVAPSPRRRGPLGAPPVEVYT